MLFLCYPKCSTCQKAKAWLEERGISYDLRDIKQDNPTAEELTAWYQKSGLPLKKFFNTSGLQYKALGLKDKLTAMSEDEQLALLEKLAEEGKDASFISLYYGEDVTEEAAQAAGTRFQAVCPDAEISVLSGGQPVYYYIISFE